MQSRFEEYTLKMSSCSAVRTMDAVVNTSPAAANGDTIGRGSNRSGWLQTWGGGGGGHVT